MHSVFFWFINGGYYACVFVVSKWHKHGCYFSKTRPLCCVLVVSISIFIGFFVFDSSWSCVLLLLFSISHFRFLLQYIFFLRFFSFRFCLCSSFCFHLCLLLSLCSSVVYPFFYLSFQFVFSFLISFLVSCPSLVSFSFHLSFQFLFVFIFV